jgi:protein phosphatase 1 regulatory subunit 37
MSVTTGAEYWTAMRLVKLYETACKGREEKPRVGIVRALEVGIIHPCRHMSNQADSTASSSPTPASSLSPV